MMLDATLVLGPFSEHLRYGSCGCSPEKIDAIHLTVLAAVLCLVAALRQGWPKPRPAPTRLRPRVSLKRPKVGRCIAQNRSGRGSWKKRGQKDIDDQRCRAIQEALIREKYLDGEPNGHWDDHSKAAMQKYQQDNGWQAKVVPDSRAIIKLGLGPSNDGLINPETAATAMSSARRFRLKSLLRSCRSLRRISLKSRNLISIPHQPGFYLPAAAACCGASSISRTLRMSVSVVNGFCRNSVPGFKTPWCAMASSE